MLLAGVMSVGAAQAQTVKGQEGAKSEAPIPAITDWSSRSIVHGKAKMPDEFPQTAAGDAELERKYRDPRYVAGVLRRIESEMPAVRTMQQRTIPQAVNKAVNDRRRGHGGGTPDESTYDGLMERDWNNVLGGSANGLGGSGVLGAYPAKYTFDIFATPSCTADFVVYGTNAAGAAGTGGLGSGGEHVLSVGQPTAGQLLTINTNAGSGIRNVVLTASTTLNTGTNFLIGADATATAINIAAAVERARGQTGVRAVRSGTSITLERLTAGTSATFVTETLGNTTLGAVAGASGTAGQPTIVAFNQLYKNNCAQPHGGNKPNVMWSYNTGNGFIVETSPVLSYYDNGAQTAFVQRNGTELQLVLLKGLAGTNNYVEMPTTLTSVAAADYRTCSAPCMLVIPFTGTDSPDSSPTYSSPYVDYTNDVIWVGDGNSRLHKFERVFRGNTPAELVTGGFPVAVSTTGGLDLSPAVSDDTYVYIGSQSGAAAGVGGMVHRVHATTAAVTSSAKLSADGRSGFRAPMILDVTHNRLNAFVFSRPGTITDASLCTHTAPTYVFCRAVVQFNTANFAAAPITREIGLGSITGEAMALWMGAFDEAYYASGTGTGAMYMCGGSLPRTQQTYLWKVPFTNGVMGLPVIGAQIGNDDADTDGIIYQCSPPTYVKNGSNEYLYVSVSGAGPAFASAPGCGNATDTNPLSSCMYMFNLNDLGAHETWTFTVNADIGNVASNITINTPATNNLNVVITAGTSQTCTATGGAFNRGSTQAADADSLRACLSLVPGFTVGGTGNSIVLTSVAPGNVAYTVTESFTNIGFANANGASATTWASTNQPRAALQIIGGTGGIIVDNVGTNSNGVVGAQQIYTTSTGTTGNAIQASQSGLN